MRPLRIFDLHAEIAAGFAVAEGILSKHHQI